jgi:Phage tail lysozyme
VAASPGGGTGGTAAGYTPPTTGPVTPKEIYYLLLAKGLSTAQAIGVMANMKAESGLDPESGGIDSNGYWAGGLISWNSEGYTDAHSLVTGNPQKDVRAQIDYLLSSTNGLKAGLRGSTAQQVAGNFAANVEVCEGCNPGSTYPNGWTTRVGYAAPLLAAAQSGNWADVATSTASPGGSSSSGAGSSSAGSGCIVKFPGIAGIGATCLLSKSQARALIGGLTLVPAAGFIVVGAVVLAAFAFRRTGAGAAAGSATQAVGSAVSVIPGGQAAGAAIAAAGSAEKRSAQRDQQARAGRETAARDRRDARQYDEVMARSRDSAKGPAVRDEPPF